MLNPSRGPDRGLFSFCFKGVWQGHPPFGDWALDAEWVSEGPASLFERPSMTVGRRKKSSQFQWVAAFTDPPCSRDNPVTETDTKAQGGQKDGSPMSLVLYVHGREVVDLLFGSRWVSSRQAISFAYVP